MTDDTSTDGSDEAQPQDETPAEPTAVEPAAPSDPWGPPSGRPAAPSAPSAAPVAPPVDGSETYPAPGAATVGLTTAGWYHSAVGNDLRYWDGMAWTAQTAPGEAPKASYGQRFRRRFWMALLVVAVLEILLAVVTLLGSRGESNTRGSAYVVGTAIGAVLGMVLLALLVTAFVALVPGPPKLDARSGLPSHSRLKAWSVLAVLVAAPIFTYSSFHTTPIAVATIANTKDGCHAYLDTVETIVKEKSSDARMKESLQALHDAAVTNDPKLAADLLPEIATPNGQTSSTATEAIMTRCLENGDLTQTEITDWAKRVQALADKLESG